MAIELKCENCIYKAARFAPICKDCVFSECENEVGIALDLYKPKEELVRQDERNKFITLLKSDLENFDGLADECVERKDIHELLENNAVRKYIESTIELLEKEQ